MKMRSASRRAAGCCDRIASVNSQRLVTRRPSSNPASSRGVRHLDPEKEQQMNSIISRRQRVWQIVGAAALASSVALGAFAYWGLYTSAGHRAYDEMDALYPAAAGA